MLLLRRRRLYYYRHSVVLEERTAAHARDRGVDRSRTDDVAQQRSEYVGDGVFPVWRAWKTWKTTTMTTGHGERVTVRRLRGARRTVYPVVTHSNTTTRWRNGRVYIYGVITTDGFTASAFPTPNTIAARNFRRYSAYIVPAVLLLCVWRTATASKSRKRPTTSKTEYVECRPRLDDKTTTTTIKRNEITINE